MELKPFGLKSQATFTGDKPFFPRKKSGVGVSHIERVSATEICIGVLKSAQCRLHIKVVILHKELDYI